MIKSMNANYIALTVSFLLHVLILTLPYHHSKFSYDREKFEISFFSAEKNEMSIKKHTITSFAVGKENETVSKEETNNPIENHISKMTERQETIEEKPVSNNLKQTASVPTDTLTVPEKEVRNIAEPNNENGNLSKNASLVGDLKTDTESNKKDSLAEYIEIIREAIDKNKEYPFYAKQAGLEGTVIIRVEILSNGKINNAAVISSSKHKSLDKAALKAVLTAGSFKAPEHFGLNQLTLDIPITYKIN